MLPSTLRLAIGAAAVLAALATMLVTHRFMTSTTDLARPATPEPAVAPLAVPPTASEHSPLMPAESAPRPTDLASTTPAWTAGFDSDDAYPHVQALLRLNTAGDSARAWEVMAPCFMRSVGERIHQGRWRDDPNAPDYTAAAQAKERLAQACRRLDPDTMNAMTAKINVARSSDPLVKLSQHLGPLEDPPDQHEAAVRAVFAQGIPFSFLSQAGASHAWWQGQSWADRIPDYRMAGELAWMRLTRSPGAEAQDLRLAYACLKNGLCAGRYDEAVTRLPEPRRGEVLALASAMEAAMRRNDPTPFLAPRPR